jgi:acetyl-CoA synthetase
MHAEVQAQPTATARVGELLDLYNADKVAAAKVLCDEHRQDSIAYRIVDPSFQVKAVSFGDLKSQSERLADALSRRGFGPGDRIATLMGKSERFLVTILAIWRLGAVHVPLFTAFAAPAIEMRLNSSASKLVFADADHLDKLGEIRGGGTARAWDVVTTVPFASGDLDYQALLAEGREGFPAFVSDGDAIFIEIYTSGTTGKPKGVPVPLRALAAFRVYAEFGLGLRQDDIFWNAGDPGWGYGLYFGILAVLTTGTTGVLFEGKFSPENYFRILEQLKVSNFAAAPTLYRSLRAYQGTVPKIQLRAAAAAGEPLTPEVNQWAPGALGVEVRDHFGQTEAGMIVNNHNHPDLLEPIRPGSMGKPMPGWSAGILDPTTYEPLPPGKTGLLAFKLSESPLAYFTGYIGDKNKTSERFSPDGKWYLTGDLASVDEDGFYYFSSRDDDVILMAGYRIGPFEIESVLSTHPAVAECAVIAVPDALRGEVLEAAVVLAEGYAPSDALTEELKTKVKREYAAHAYPRQIHYRQALPKTPSGKLQRFVIRKELSATARPEGGA